MQAKREPHLRHHACSTRRRKMRFSHLALARASWVKNDRVSSEKRPPTSTPSTTKRARARLPTSSGYVASLRLRALVTLAPSSTAARVVGRPSLRSAHTKVVSTANWAPLKIGRPSTTISSRLPSASEPTKPRSRSRNNTLVVTRPPPSRQIRAATLSRAHPRLPRTPARARCSVVAQRVEREATPAGTHGKGEGELEPAQQSDSEKMGLHLGDTACGATRENQTSSRSTLGTNCCHGAVCHPGEETVPEGCVNPRSNFVLPTGPGLPQFKVVRIEFHRSSTACQSPP